MDKEEFLQKFYDKDRDEKNLFLEYLVFCQFADDHDFENYFRIEELEEGELFCLIGFLYHQDCFLMMLEIMNRHKQRFVSHSVLYLDEIVFSEQFTSRLEKMGCFS